MIDLSVRRPADSAVFLKVIGVGGAGIHALDRMVLDGVNPSHLVACHTEMQTLTASVAGGKIQLGCEVTRGLGTGGDPEAGVAAVSESEAALRTAVEGVDVVFLLAGLGGGTGSGGAPRVAQIAREQGALVIALVTLPFHFEGRRRVAQGQAALEAMLQSADMVICYENDRMALEVPPGAGVAQAFAASDHTLSQSVQAMTALFYRKGLIHVGFDEFRNALGGARALFGMGVAQGNNRPYEALALALKNPLMDKGRMLREADRVLIAVAGGEDLTLAEIELLMEEFNRVVGDRPQVYFTVAVDTKLAGSLSVTLFSALKQVQELAPVEPIPQVAPEEPTNILPWPLPVDSVVTPPFENDPSPVQDWQENDEFPSGASAQETQISNPEIAAHEERFQSPPEESEPLEEEIEPEVASPIEPSPQRVTRPVPGRSLRGREFLNPRPVAPVPEPEAVPASLQPTTPAPAEPESASAPVSSKTPTQETLKFDPVTRGRFEKSEPTIVDGEDLDVPTFMRRNIRFRQP